MTNLQARLSAQQFLQYYVFGSWIVTNGTYMLQELDFTGSQVGVVYGSSAVAAMISPFFLGLVADRYLALERLLALLNFLGAALLILAAQLDTFFWYYTVILIYMVCYIPTTSLSNSLCLQNLKRPAQQFPRVRVFGTLAWIVAGLVVGSLGVEPTNIPLYIAAGASALSGIYALTLPHTPPSRMGGNIFRDLFKGEARLLFREGSFLVMLLALTLICYPRAYYYSFVNPFLNEIGMRNAAGVMTLGQGTEVVFMLLLPYIFRLLRLRYIFFLGLFCWGFRYWLFGQGDLQDNAWMIYLGIALHGPAFNFSIFASQIYVDGRVPRHLRSTAQGFITLITMGFGVLISSYIAGAHVNAHTLSNGHHQWDTIWVLPAWVGMGVALGFVLLFRSRGRVM